MPGQKPGQPGPPNGRPDPSMAGDNLKPRGPQGFPYGRAYGPALTAPPQLTPQKQRRPPSRAPEDPDPPRQTPWKSTSTSSKTPLTKGASSGTSICSPRVMLRSGRTVFQNRNYVSVVADEKDQLWVAIDHDRQNDLDRLLDWEECYRGVRPT